jgi:hypothetical protein
MSYDTFKVYESRRVAVITEKKLLSQLLETCTANLLYINLMSVSDVQVLREELALLWKRECAKEFFSQNFSVDGALLELEGGATVFLCNRHDVEQEDDLVDTEAAAK